MWQSNVNAHLENCFVYEPKSCWNISLTSLRGSICRAGQPSIAGVSARKLQIVKTVTNNRISSAKHPHQAEKSIDDVPRVLVSSVVTSCDKIWNKFQFFEVTLFTWRGKKKIPKSLCNLCNYSNRHDIAYLHLSYCTVFTFFAYYVFYHFVSHFHLKTKKIKNSVEAKICCVYFPRKTVVEKWKWAKNGKKTSSILFFFFFLFARCGRF